ncbi:MAG: hypothetical protein M1828_007244 [Chrysothrix sp. TS-e1954]|nr:MAG: hypothetical protein M1828_007244 [Chrysothrix sp. TS-e1954]
MSFNNPFVPPQTPPYYNDAVFQPDNAQDFARAQMLSPSFSQGTVRIPTRLLREPSSSNDSSILSRVVASPETGSSEGPEVPLFEQSPAFFKWLGFNSSTANDLHLRWIEWAASGLGGEPSSVLDFAIDHVQRLNINASGDGGDWKAVMTQVGVEADLQDAIMCPISSDIRCTQSLQYWLIDTFRMRYRVLRDIQSKEKERKEQRQKERSYQRHQKREQQQQQKEPKEQRQKTQDEESPNVNDLALPSTTTEDPTHPNLATTPTGIQPQPDHLLLWKSLDVARTKGLLTPTGKLANLSPLLDRAPGDFSGVQSLFYFSPSKELAEAYALFALTRIQRVGGDVCLLAVQIPHSLLDQFSKAELFWPDDAWKQAVFESRNGWPFSREISHLDDVDLFVGHVGRNGGWTIEALACHGDLGVENVMRVTGSREFARQYVFGLGVRFQLKEACGDLVTIVRSRYAAEVDLGGAGLECGGRVS